MTACIRRREFITLLGGATVAWPLAAQDRDPFLRDVAEALARLPQRGGPFSHRLAENLTRAALGEPRWGRGLVDRARSAFHVGCFGGCYTSFSDRSIVMSTQGTEKRRIPHTKPKDH
jgi:hypothetical protein